jgi:hypothetical protein
MCACIRPENINGIRNPNESNSPYQYTVVIGSTSKNHNDKRVKGKFCPEKRGGRNVWLVNRSGVNPRLAHEIFEKLVKLRDNYGITFFIIEHRLDIALSYVDKVVAMAFGKFVTAGAPQQVTADKRVIEAYLGG